MRPEFLDPAVIHQDLDAPHARALPAPERLVFVLGLHRSGTTFLYELLAAAFPLAATHLYHITHYRRLLHLAREGREAEQRAALDAHLQALGLATRGTDGIRVHAGGLEEYAFILRRFAGRWGHAPASAGLLDELLRKQAHLAPGARGVLVKNPHDLGAIAALHAADPAARFVVIRRDPVRVLDSQLRAGLRYRRHPEYLDVLMAGTPGWRAFLPGWRASGLVVPDSLYERFLLTLLPRDIGRALHEHQRALAGVPPAAYVTLRYEDLVAGPGPALEHVRDLIDLPFRDGFVATPPAPREQALSATVAACAPWLRRSWADHGWAAD